MAIGDNLRQRMRDWLGVKAAPDLTAIGAEPWIEQARMPSLATLSEQERTYTWSAWIFAAVSRIATTAAIAPFSVKELAGEERNDIENHPFELLMQDPNPVDSRYTFLEQLFSFLALTNNAYVWLNRANESAPPEEMYVIPSREIQPHPDGRLNIDGYEYYPDGQPDPLFLPPWQVMHVKRFNSMSRFVGLSPIEVAQLAVLTDKAQAEWNYKHFGKHNAKVPGVLAFPDPIVDTTWERMKAEFYGDKGQGATRNVVLMRNVGTGTPKWIPTQLNQAEMQFLESRQFNKEEIYDLFAPGLAAMTAINATEANARTAKATFMDFTVWPAMVAVAEAFTHDVLSAYGANLVGEFDDIRVTDRAMELQEYQAYSRHATLNEARQTRNVEPLVGELYEKVPLVVLERLDAGTLRKLIEKQLGIEHEPVPPGLTPFGSGNPPPQGQTVASAPAGPAGVPGDAQLSAPTPQENMQQGAAKAVSIALLEDLNKWCRKSHKREGPCEFESEHIPGWLNVAIKTSVEAAGLDAWAFLKAQPVARDEAERRVLEFVMRVLSDRFRRFLLAIMRGAELEQEYQDLAAELNAGLYPILAALATEVILREALETGVEFDPAAVNVAAADWARNYTYNLVTGLTETTRGVVSRAIEQFIATPGMTEGELEALLAPAFGQVRAEMIAITEVTRAYSAATNVYQQMLAEAGIAMRRVFRTRADERVCIVCGPLDGKDERVWAEDYPDGPPLHTRCRCWTTLELSR